MGRWYYSSMADKGDGGNGTHLWRKLAETSKLYMPASIEEQLVAHLSLTANMRETLKGVRSVCELGPGGTRSIERKTVPLLCLVDDLQSYVAVDVAEEFSRDATQIISHKLEINTHHVQADVFQPNLPDNLTASDLVVAFGMIGNIIAPVGAAPEKGLIDFLRTIRQTLNDDGIFTASFCAEMDGQKVLGAYLDEANRKFCLGIVHHIAQNLPVTGMFDPAAWEYKPVWHDKVKQCAHMIYPVREQSFRIGGRVFNIQPGEEFHLSNSYRYTPAQIRFCADEAGFVQADVFTHGTAGLLVARNKVRQAVRTAKIA